MIVAEDYSKDLKVAVGVGDKFARFTEEKFCAATND